MLLQYDRNRKLPTAKDLPHTDDTPVDNELQNDLPNLLRAMLASIWADRRDWFFGVDMGIYYDPDQPAIIPDGFLSIGVPRWIGSDLRLSYVLWEEQKLPILVLEVVSKTRRGEYTTKKDFYEEMGILYYVIHNPLRKRKQKLEIYKLNNGKYELLEGEAVWLPEISIGIMREKATYMGLEYDWVYWMDEQGKRYLTPEEQVKEAQQQAQEAQQQAQEAQQQAQEAQQQAQEAQQQAQEAQRRAELLEERLRGLGIDPNELE